MRDESKPEGWYCPGTSKQTGNPCGKRAGFGTDHVGFGLCKFHGGATRNGKRHAQTEEAVEAVATYGLPRVIDPRDALVEELHRTAGHVAWLQSLVGDLEHEPGAKTRLKQYQATEAGGTVERPAVWLEMYWAERKHLAQIAKTCHDVGIEARMVELAESQADELVRRFQAFCSALALDMGSDEVRRAFRVALSSQPVIEGTATAV